MKVKLMRVLFVGVEECGAVSKILLNALKMVKDKSIEFCTFGIGDSKRIHNNNLTCIFDNSFSFSAKLSRKIRKIFGRDYYLVSWKNVEKRLDIIGEEFAPDIVVAASGSFCYMKAAFEYSKRKKKPLVLMFFDPFQNNALIKNKEKAIRECLVWCNYASKVLYDKDGEIPAGGIRKDKLVPFYIPIFEDVAKTKPNKSIIYGGMFYKTFRKPDSLINLINKTNEDVIFEIYTESYFGNIIKEQTAGKARIHNLMPESDFSEICNECLAIIALGNGKEKNTIPSKLLDAIGHKKPILGLNFNSEPEYLKKYPFFFNCDKDDGIKKILLLDYNLLKTYNIFYNFPERKPSIFINLLFDVLRGINQ